MTVDIARLSDASVSARCWPDVARVPSGPLSIVAAPIADRLFRNAASRLPLRMVYPDGTVVGAADPTLPTMVIHRPDSLARRIGRYGLIGFGESYMAGEWSSDDLAGVLTEFASSVGDLIPRSLQRLRPIAVVRQPRSQFNSREQARQNISEHYDLSNELFAEFLDETLTYSSAMFDTLPATRSQLADAQRRKIDRLLDSAKVGPGSRVLEIGTGWGELCIRAASRGALVRSVTLSAEQQQLARERVDAEGLSDRVDIELLDYRDIDGCYDAVVSVEMIEAVGYRFWPDVLPNPRPAGVARWTGGDPGHHDAQQPNAGVAQHIYLDPEVHLPRRPIAVRRSDHRYHRRAHAAADGGDDIHRPALRGDAAAVA